MLCRSLPVFISHPHGNTLVLAGCGGRKQPITPPSSPFRAYAYLAATSAVIRVWRTLAVPTVFTAATPATVAISSTVTIPAPTPQAAASTKNLAPDIGISGPRNGSTPNP